MSHQTVARGIHAISNIQGHEMHAKFTSFILCTVLFTQKFTLIRLSSSNVTKRLTLNCDPSENAHNCFAHKGLSF